MATFNSYNEVKQSTDWEALVEHCKEAVEENNEMNDAKTSDWNGGVHIAETYLEHNVLWSTGGEDCKKITDALDKWLSGQ